MVDFSQYNLVLASASPRRKQLLEGLDLKFKVFVKEVDEGVDKIIDSDKYAEFHDSFPLSDLSCRYRTAC